MNALTLAAPLLALAATLAGAAPAPPAARARPAARPPAQVRAVLPFIHDDWTRALAQAKARRLPMFVESWAPW